ncbi:hypothetical protein HNQ06_000995 [Borrelia lanei]|uniref:Uncharacterized protein n=1 Tax=Borreliella lanei TaxID=373540 RepID=A0A7W9ZBS4_9SPIR|nr:hypothetical protein [Borreliella lanei]
MIRLFSRVKNDHNNKFKNAQADKFSIYLVNSLNKEEKCIYLFPIRDGDAFWGCFMDSRRSSMINCAVITLLFVNFSKKYLRLLIKFVTLNLGSKWVVYFYISTL